MNAHPRTVLIAVVCMLLVKNLSLRCASLAVEGSSSTPVPQISPLSTSPPSKTLSPEERGDIFMARKNYADAVDYYHRALERKDEARLWNKLGIAYQQQLDFAAARKAYERAIHERRDFAEAWNNLGTIYYLGQKPKRSLKYYRHAIQLNPQSACFHMNLGTAYYRLKKPQKAVEEYRQALVLDPNILNEHSSVGTVLDAARGGDVEYYFYMAKVFASLGRIPESIRYLRRAFEDGFKDVKKLDEDPDFLKISKDPAYIALRNNPPLPIRN